MGGTWTDMRGPIVADTVYRNGVLCARDVAVTLPAVNFLTYDFRVMGTMTMPVVGLLEDMEATISKIGVDEGLVRLLSPVSAVYEFRWIQTVLRADGTTIEEGCKAFLRAIPKILLPAIAVDPGNAVEMDIPLGTTRYELIAGGRQYALIDRFAGSVRLNGVDYTQSRQSLL